jgi:polysaccharide biosynthesis/export protein
VGGSGARVRWDSPTAGQDTRFYGSRDASRCGVGRSPVSGIGPLAAPYNPVLHLLWSPRKVIIAMNLNSFRWVACLLAIAWGASLSPAADSESPPKPAASGETPASFSGSLPGQRAQWQQRLTLGPGDILNLSLLEMPETARTEVPVGPDGRISFLQASDVLATGLTVDELRAKLDEVLGKYYRNPRTIIAPVAFRSKKYFVLGAVANKGVYVFDRPTRVIEAIARAGGLETGLSDTRTVEMADLQRSILVRNGQRVPVDFDRLFRHGDLSQNVFLEPNDYLYFAQASENEIYVLGEVAQPGLLVFAARPTVISAISARGGYTTRSFRSRVLVVRGSLDHPETFVVDTSAVLKGQAPDFKLQPRDIVYVSKNPWIIAGEVLDLAVKSFVTALTVQGTTQVIPAAIHL